MKTILALAAALMFAWPAAAQTDSRDQRRSGGLTRIPCGPEAKGFCIAFNGYYWKRMNRDSQVTFTTAYREGAETVLRTLRPKAEDPEIRDFLSLFQPLGELDSEIAGMNGFYAVPENLGVPIYRAFQVLAMKTGDTAAAVEKRTEEFRKEANTYK
jgi:hypothetical protein